MLQIIPRIGVAMDILTEMKKEGYAGKVDFAFIGKYFVRVFEKYDC